MENPSSTSSPHRIGFYPCCCDDIEEPRRFLAPLVDEILFCDIKRCKAWDHVRDEEGLPKATFIQGDVRELIATLPPLRVLFYRNDSNGESGSGLHIVGRIWLPKILARFDWAGGWIFSDGANSNGGKSFQKLLCSDWHEKPSSGFRFRKVDGFNLSNRHGLPVHAIEVKPLPLKLKKVRFGWVEPGDKHAETVKSLWNYCTANDRLVPMPNQWSDLYAMLRSTHQKPSGGWEPPLPLILAAWHHSMPIDKQMRFKEHLKWAEVHGQLEEISCFLRSLTETQWCHFGEI
jgi:hypothetical protein